MDCVLTVTAVNRELILKDKDGEEHVSNLLEGKKVKEGDIIVGTLTGRKWTDYIVLVNRSDSAAAATVFNILKFTKGRRSNLNKIAVSRFLMELKGTEENFRYDKQLTTNMKDESSPAMVTHLSEVERKSLVRGWKKHYCHRFNLLGIKNRDITGILKQTCTDYSSLYDKIMNAPYTIPQIPIENADRISQITGNIDNVMRMWAVITRVLTCIYQESGWTFVPVECIDASLNQYIPGEVHKYPKLYELSKKYDSPGSVIVTDTYMRLKWLDDMEHELADYLLQCHADLQEMNELSEDIDIFEANHDFRFQPEQREALQSIINRGVTLIDGEAGTGKTTMIQMACKFFEEYFKDCEIVLPTSFTGKAARRMEEGKDGMKIAMTIHSFMNRYKKTTDSKNVILIIDEISMVDTELCWTLLMFIKSLFGTVRLVFIGDIEQLPPINRTSFVSAYIDSKLPIVTLIKNHRSNNVILANAHIVIGKPVPDEFASAERNTTTGFITNDDFELMGGSVYNLLNWAKLNKKFVESALLLSPYNKVCDELNSKLRELINPGPDDWRENDLVMQTKNFYSEDYEILYDNKSGKITGWNGYKVVNGDIGVIKKVGAAEIECKFKGHKSSYIYKRAKTKFPDIDDDPFSPDEVVGELDTHLLKHRYCLTIHKSQGSESDNGILFIPKGASPMLTRNLLYTAMTRFKKKLKIIGDMETVRRMIDTPIQRPLEMLSQYIMSGL